MGLGTLVLLTNAALLWLYTLSCHSCRHIVGGRLQALLQAPAALPALDVRLPAQRPAHAARLVSLFGVALTDVYVRLVASGAIHDPRFF